MTTSDFDYELPEGLIAKYPTQRRETARMMVVSKSAQTIEHRYFKDLSDLIPDKTIAVLNNCKVEPARFFIDEKGYEILRIAEIEPLVWRCLTKPARRFKAGRKYQIGNSELTVIEELTGGERIIGLSRPIPADLGKLPLPPYLHRPEEAIDAERYQTVFASQSGAIAAPTAGLHFTEEILAKIPHAFINLSVGIGTFKPVKVEDFTAHQMHAEQYSISLESADKINSAKKILCIGTTTLRALEANCIRGNGLASGEKSKSKVTSGDFSTNIFIYPPYDFKVADMLLTNFHLPKSTLLMLVSAFAGKDFVMKQIYPEAVRKRYRFFSYGDCMLILP